MTHVPAREGSYRVFLALFVVTFCCLVPGTVLLLALGHRLRFASRIVGLVLVVGVAGLAGWVARRSFGLPTEPVLAGQVLVVAAGVLVVATRPRWNPVGQAAFATFLAAGLTYLSFAADYTLFGGLSALGMAASGFLFPTKQSGATCCERPPHISESLRGSRAKCSSRSCRRGRIDSPAAGKLH